MAVIDVIVPTSFDVLPFGGQWFHWTIINLCFWPGKGCHAANINPALAPVRVLGGVYCFAWSVEIPRIIGPKCKSVRYIGETGEFRRRMGQFGYSAGFWSERSKGHSAGWRWPKGQTENAWVCFFPIGNELLPHLAAGMRLWMEAVALEEYRQSFDRLPEINEAVAAVEGFDK